MKLPKSGTFIRIISALVALVVLLGLYYFLKQDGLLVVIAVAALIAQMEFSQLVIDRPSISFSRALLVAGCFIITLSSLFLPNAMGVPMGFVLIVFFSFFLVHYRASDNLVDIRDTIGTSALGLLYVGLLPSFIVGILRQPSGDIWFFTLLAIVFMGDTFAYFVGRAMGVKKIMPTISPNKTWAGAVGGIFGSILGATTVKLLFFPEIPVLPMVLLAILSGAFAQIGDFFESLLKRVANKKDSGALMPGHGGILDRIDGVLFAAPFVYFASRYFLGLFSSP